MKLSKRTIILLLLKLKDAKNPGKKNVGEKNISRALY